MKVIELRAERFKRLSAVDVTPNGENIVEVCGRNGQGKTSVLDAIWLALSGSAGAKNSGTVKPVKDGERDAVVTLDLGDIKVTRKWNSDGKSSLSVESSTGKKFTSPQSLLDSLIGNFSFDPLAFARMAPKEQRKALLDLVKLDVDPDAIDAKIKSLYDERTIVNRQQKSYTAELSGMQVPSENTPTVELSINEEMKKLEAARSLRADIVRKREKLTALREKARAMQEELSVVIAQGKALSAELSTAQEPDVDAIEKSVMNIDAQNKYIREKQRYADLVVRAETEDNKSKELTKQMESLEKSKTDAFRSAKMPIDGLSFDSEGLIYKNVPFSQCSSAEQMKICIAIASALNPKIRVVRVKDASLLDEESMNAVMKMAADLDMQIWLERVGDEASGGGVKILIEDGTVRS